MTNNTVKSSGQECPLYTFTSPKLLSDNVLGNLVAFESESHTPFTYHRTWETGLGVEI